MTKKATEPCARLRPGLAMCIQQDIYLRDASRAPVTRPASPSSSDVILRDEHVDVVSGQVDRLVRRPYPINADYVNGFLAQTDYKSAPEALGSLPPRGINLGDVTQVQKTATMDTARLSALYQQARRSLDAINSYLNAQKSSGSVPAANSQSATSEVK